METALPRLRQVFGEQLTDSVRAPLPAHTRRRLFRRVQLPGKVTAIIGMRGTGKTTFLHQLRRERIDRGVPRERLPYLTFEDERLAGVEASHLAVLVSEYHRRFPQAYDDGATVTWFLDGIQAVPGWERFVRRILDTERSEVFVTGSSAALFSPESATPLRGRAWQLLIHPFSFEEALLRQGRSVPEGTPVALLTGREHWKLERALLDWLETGGFPAVQGLDPATRHRLLRDHVDVALLRDVVERHEVRNAAGLRWLVRRLLGHAGSGFSGEKFHKALKSQGISIGKDTVHRILSHLEDCFLVRLVWMESNSERQRMVNPRKAYPVDAGLIPVFDRTGPADSGPALETAILVELERRGFEVTYVRLPGGNGAAFLARGTVGDVELIRVCADLSDPAAAAREFGALAAAGASFPRARKRLLVLTRDRLPAETPVEVEVQTACEWLLEPPLPG